jgi:hypothetical protein
VGRTLNLEALKRDADVLTRLNHRNVVRVHAWLLSGADPYLVLQYVPGNSLKKVLDEQGPLPWARAARYAADVGEGLLAAHALGVIHCDIKPANILWDPAADEALLTDFGVAVWLSDGRPHGGTPGFMPPEALKGVVSPKLDVYSLAVTLYQLVTGKLPFPPGGSGVLPEPDDNCRTIPAALEQALRAGLAPEPDQRPELSAFIEALRGSLNVSLADALAAPAKAERVRLVVSRREGGGQYEEVASTHRAEPRRTRDLVKVPPEPRRVRLRTGDEVRIEVVAAEPGHVTVYNVGPTGNLNPLHGPGAPPLIAGRPLHILDVRLQAPAGKERLFAVWTRQPLAVTVEQLRASMDRNEAPPSRAYRATRDMVKVQEAVQRLPPGDWSVSVLELDHEP